MKRIITLLLIISTLFSVLSLTACDLDEGSKESKEKTVTVSFTVEADATPVSSQTVESDACVEKPADPSRSGYAFLGWYLNGVPFDFSTPITEDITLVAMWTESSADIPEEESPKGDGWWDNITYEQTTLTFKLTKNSNLSELTSGCERYMEGAGTYADDIDEMVEKRNADALYYTNIEKIIYSYYTDTSEYFYTKAFDVMHDEIHNPDIKSADMYCNYVPDMFVASLHGCFANIKSTANGANYFNLKDDGYMTDYMSSTTLNPQKLYLVASDYFIDFTRSFYCVPVNVALYNEIVNANLCNDYDDSKSLDVNDLFAQVEAGEWTYRKLMDYCSALYAKYGDTNSDVIGDDINDTLGFALAQISLPARALVYSSSVKFISKDGTDYGYCYDEENQALYDLAGAIQSLVESESIMCVKLSDAASINKATSYLAIRTQFTNGKMLFGGICVLDDLTKNEYQSMHNGDGTGFGVLPVPVYKNADRYNTAVHVTAKVGAISSATQKFSECTAFLHYNSSHSDEIMAEYLDSNFTLAESDFQSGNLEMIKLMHSSLRNGFDFLAEEAIQILHESGTNSGRWHGIIVNSYYCAANIRIEYAALAVKKNSYLNEIIGKYLRTEQ